MFIRILPTTPLQIFCENLLYFYVIFKSMKVADDTFLGNSEWKWVNTTMKVNFLMKFLVNSAYYLWGNENQNADSFTSSLTLSLVQAGISFVLNFVLKVKNFGIRFCAEGQTLEYDFVLKVNIGIRFCAEGQHWNKVLCWRSTLE